MLKSDTNNTKPFIIIVIAQSCRLFREITWSLFNEQTPDTAKQMTNVDLRKWQKLLLQKKRLLRGGKES